MSNIVQIWEQPEGMPRPADAAQACRLPELAGSQPEGAWPTARLEAFRQRILERWPVVDERVWDANDPAATRPNLGVWKDDALRADLRGRPLLVLDTTTQSAEVLGWLAEEGPRAGVNVCDPDRRGANTWLADGSVFTTTDEGACILALARLKARDDRAAWEQLVELVVRGNRKAVDHLSKLYEDGRWVGRDLAIAWALQASVQGWRFVDGVASLPEGQEARHFPALPHDRAQLDDAGRARADALLARLIDRQPLRESLLAAAHEFDARYAAAHGLIAAGQVEAAALRLRTLADRGHRPSQHALAGLWARGLATPDDPVKEWNWIARLSELLDAPAMVALARLHEEGVLTPCSPRGARGIHRLLVSHGETPAVREASRIELARLVGPPTGKFWEGRSEEELEPLVAQGDVAAMVELARLIEWGRHTLEAFTRSMPLWQRAAQAGHARAQYTVAYAYENGRVVANDDTQATHWYGLAANNGDAASQYKYAKRLHLGLGIARDRAQSERWLEAAARQRDLSALSALAENFANGDMHSNARVASQVLVVLHDRRLGAASDEWRGPDQVDAREVRRLLADIEGGADLVDVLKRYAPAPAPARPAAAAAPVGLSLAPMAVPRGNASAPAPAPAPAPARTPASARPVTRTTLATQRHDADDADDVDAPRVFEPLPRSPIGPLLIVASVGVLAIAVTMLRRDADTNVLAPWLIGSALAAAGAYRVSREAANPSLVAAMDAAPMFIPFVGSALAARMLYQRWRPAP